MSCPYVNQQRGGAGATDYVERVVGGIGHQEPISATDNSIKFKGGSRNKRKSKGGSILSKIMKINNVFKRNKTYNRSSRKRHHKRRRTHRK